MATSFVDDQPIHDAAVLLVVDQSGDAPQILMGRRHKGLAFMANKVVFPGGRVDPSDHLFEVANGICLRPDTEAALARHVTAPFSPTLPLALALTSIRETAEETGALLAHAKGAEADSHAMSGSPMSDDAAWHPFLTKGHVPAIDCLHYFFRAITPPGQSRRFDTRFFLADAVHLHCGPTDEACGELGSVGWFSFEKARQTELAMITRIVLDEAETRLDELRQGEIKRDLPFYYFENGVRVNEFIQAGI